MTTTPATRLNDSELVDFLRASPFNKSCYTVDVAFSGFLKNISMFTHGKESHTYDPNNANFTLDQDPSRLFECVPPFQRDNDKWTRAMQIKFIENLLQGYATTLMFYEVSEDDQAASRTSCMILDGLQRLTAIHDFITGKFLVYGYSHDELVANRVLRRNLLTVKICDYVFRSEAEAVEFYISMNENITHSPADIQRAKDYLISLKGK